MLRILVIGLALGVTSCVPPASGDSGTAADDAGGVDGGGIDDGGSGAGIAVDLDLGARCAASVFASCAITVPLPERVTTVIESLDPNGDVPGRCDGSDLDEAPAIVLPDDPAAYPVLVRVAGAGFLGECSSCGESRMPYGFTTYGVAIDTPYELRVVGGFSITASVNSPWRVVSGGCGEACPHNCLSEYLEFEPSTCLASYASGFGVATDVEDPPVAEVVFQLVSAGFATPCCHLPCGEDR